MARYAAYVAALARLVKQLRNAWCVTTSIQLAPACLSASAEDTGVDSSSS